MGMRLSLCLFSLMTAGQSLDLRHYFPTAAGTTLTYDVTRETRITTSDESRQNTSGGTIVERFLGENEKGLVTLQRAVTQVTADGSAVVTTVTASEVTVNAIGVGNANPTPLEVPQPLLLRELPGHAVAGAIGDLRLVTRLTSQSTCTVEVSAGLFADCVRTETTGAVTGTLNAMPVREGSIRVDAWFARDVGLVREERTMRLTVEAPDGRPIGVEERSVKSLTK